MHFGRANESNNGGGSRWLRRAAVACAAVLGAGGALAAPLVASAHTTIVVHPGESIQTAVDNAKPGDTVKVLEGTYTQQVNITKSNITLKGEGASDTIITAPNAFGGNCDAGLGPTGICVGATPITEGGTVTTVLTGVTIENLTVTGFPGSGLFVFGTDGAKVEDVHATSNGVYGIFFNASTNGVIRDNLATGSGEAGIYYGDTPNATAWISDNTVRDNAFGIFLRDVSHGTVVDNTAKGNCAGIVFLSTGGGVTNWLAKDNEVNRNNKACLPQGPRSAISGVGILVLSGSHITITENEVERNNKGHNASFGSGGIIVVTRPHPGAPPSDHISVTKNELENNATDLVWDGLGSGNTFSANDCDTSGPPGLC